MVSSNTVNPRISAQGGYFKFTRRRKAFIRGGRLIEGVGGGWALIKFFPNRGLTCSFFNTAYPHKQQH